MFYCLRTINRLSPGSRLICLLAALSLAATAGLASAAEPVSVQVVEDTGNRIVLQYDLGDFARQPVLIQGREYTAITLGEEASLKQSGAPELPSVRRSVIIPDDATMAVNVLASEHYDITAVDVAPSKGHLLRTVDPQAVPYTFGPTYDMDAFYPGELATLREPYILRDHRGLVVELNPFQYNPVTRTLRVYTQVTVEVSATGPGLANVLHRQDRGLSLAFHQLYKHHFLNYDAGLRYAPLDEEGDLLIICYDSWLSNVQPLVNHKNAIGIDTTIVGVSTIGNNSTAIKNYIQNAYNTGDLAFVLLVGDSAQVATPSASGGAADPTYAKVAGGDNYPDIVVGRFSATLAAHVDTQVLRTVEYEQIPATTQGWFKRGTGIASAEGPGHNGEYDYVHMGYIRNDLLGYGYTLVDQIYDPGATASQVTNAVNAGRGIINYCGHGSRTAWGTTGFSSTHVNNLTNDNMLPFIFDVACVNGQFAGYTCFAEAWLRATHGSEPTGAIGIYASSINQYWDPPMTAQDESVDLLVAETYFSFGALCYAGSCKMIDYHGLSGVTMFNTWHVFGDPSVRVYGVAEPPETCDDGIQNQGEQRIDCGGPNCPPCDCLSDGECDDGAYCDGVETCDAYGHCQEGTAVNCPDDGAFCNGNEFCNEAADTCGHSGDPCTPPEVCDEETDTCFLEPTTIVGATSCLDHNGQEYCLNLELDGPATCEPRQGGVIKLAVQTVDPVQAGGTTASVSCSRGVYTGSVIVICDGTTTVTVNLDPLPKEDCCTIDFEGDIIDSVPVMPLAGDVDRDGVVSTADGSSITQRLGMTLDVADFWYDADRDGSITTGDASFVTQRLNNVAPVPCP